MPPGVADMRLTLCRHVSAAFVFVPICDVSIAAIYTHCQYHSCVQQQSMAPLPNFWSWCIRLLRR